MKNCFCGSNKEYSACCGLYIEGKKHAPTPEALMRSRYSAFTQGNMDYIVATMRGKAGKDFDAASAKTWANESEWLGLTIAQAPPIPEGDTKGFVEFIARYRLKGQEQQIHELSEFQLENGRWYYVDGKFLDTDDSQQRKTIKTGRNDPCVCGSGKKYKKCCG